MFIRIMEKAPNQRLIPLVKFVFQPFGCGLADNALIQHSLNRQACSLVVQFGLGLRFHGVASEA